ncbi:GNAT family N-acetyltransferase [Streptomyces phytohabitans]|uniref:GNAT family N-acetyltransferase n=1 Tax=Streptomyces phytohabitans TaxID=1150371 RepID=UPI00345C0F2E
MTTTLRPSGPEEHTADGARSRTYAVCDNARAVGTLRLSVDTRYGLRTGRIAELAVDPPERRRGRAAIALLAAEEVLQGWGCARVAATVPADAEGASVLAGALGYVERNRTLTKPLTHPVDDPAPAPGTLRPLAEQDFAAWRERDGRRQVAALTDRGVPADRAGTLLADELRALLPDGPATTGMLLRVLVHDGADVGTLWLSPSASPRPAADAWVWGVEVHDAYRRHGHGRTLMRAAERASHDAGASALGLNVHVDNAPARRLYESLGYRAAEHHLEKRLL